MRVLKMFGLMAIAALAVMALVGVSSAAAEELNESVFCEEEPLSDHCPIGAAYSLPLMIHAELASGTEATLNAAVQDKCKKSLVLLTATEYKAHSIHGEIESVTFNECSCPTSNAIKLPWLALLDSEGGGAGTLLASDGGNGNPGGLVVCTVFGSPVHCTYETTTGEVEFLDSSLTGGLAVTVANVPLQLNTGESDGACIFGGQATWEAEYEVLDPDPLYLALYLHV